MTQPAQAKPETDSSSQRERLGKRFARWLAALVQVEGTPWLVSFSFHFLLIVVLALFMTAGAINRGVPNVSIELADSGDSDEPGGSAPSLDYRIGKGTVYGEVVEATRASIKSAKLKPAASSLDRVVANLTPGDMDSPFSDTMAISGTAKGSQQDVVGLEDAEGVSKPGGGKPGRGFGTGVGDGIGSGRGKGKISLFGAKGEGNRFIYALDRSGSMARSNLLEIAKRELWASLQKLKPSNEFQVIFYNEEPFIFNPQKGPDRFFRATNKIRSQVYRFIEGIYPFDGTDHQKALFRAIRMRPDVIFLFTDADEPRLGPYELEQIHLEANGIIINTIEVGYGPEPPDNNNFLVLLARQNKGQHVYIDINTLAPQ